MNCIILSSHLDHSAQRMVEEFEKSGITVHFALYSELMKSPITAFFDQFDTHNSVLIPRQPYTANDVEDQYSALLRKILNNHTFKYVFDHGLYQSNFMEYEDKFFQAQFFEEHQLPHATTCYINTFDDSQFPLVAKRRISSRGAGNILLHSREEYTHFAEVHNIFHYMYQRYYPLIADYRVLVLFGKVVGIVERETHIKDDGRLTVTVKGQADLPQEILDASIKIAEKLQCDLCGIDIGKKEDGELFFIEYNTSPQFTSLEKKLGINVAASVVEALLEKTNTV